MAATEINGDDSPIVKTTYGPVRGQLLHGLYNEPYYCFDGIPYAAPPLGPLRFKAPQTPQPWHDNILDCTQPKSKCLQLSSYTKVVEGSEDCLYLNIYAKKLQGTKPLPVMVYIHGGGCKTGDATRRALAPDYFMHEEIILITIGYRLGVFGFLTFADSKLEIPGNAGIKDVVLALKWIKENCSNFNGDSERITLFGHSSGGGIVEILMISPQAQNLFHRAIIMAGYQMELNRLPNVEFRLAQHYGYDGPQNDAEILQFLNGLSAEQLADYNFWTVEEKNRDFNWAFIPCVEPYATHTAVLLDEPISLHRNAWSNHMSIMVGTTSHEFNMVLPKYLNNSSNEMYRKHPEYLLPHTLYFKNDLGTQRLLAKKLIDLHYENRQICAENAEYGAQLQSYFIYHAQHRLLSARLAYANAPNYVYRFDLDSPDFNFYRIRSLGPDSKGTVHADVLGYLFVLPASFKLDKTRIEYTTIRRMISIWTSFAANGDPNNELLGADLKWEPVKRFGSRKCLNISNSLSIIEWPEWRLCQKIDQLYEQVKIPLF